MENQKPNGRAISLNGKQTIQSAQLMRLFEDQLEYMYWTEKELTKAIPKLIQNATSANLIEALSGHMAETYKQVERLAKIFASIQVKPAAKKCEAMQGLIEDAEDIIASCKPGAMCDAGIITAAHKVERYEIATYGSMRQFAQKLGLHDAVRLINATLEEEIAADEELAEIAAYVMIVEATKVAT